MSDTALVTPPRPTSPLSQPASKGELRYMADGSLKRWDGLDWVDAFIIDARPAWYFFGGSGQVIPTNQDTNYIANSYIVRGGPQRYGVNSEAVQLNRSAIYMVSFSARLTTGTGERTLIIERQNAAGIRQERAQQPIANNSATVSRTFWCAATDILIARVWQATGGDLTTLDNLNEMNFQGVMLSL